MKRAFTIGLTLLVSLSLAGLASAQGVGANKVTYTASVVDVVGPTVPVVILGGSIKTSTRADLILSFTAECLVSIKDIDDLSLSVFGFTFFDSDFEIDTALAVVKVWVEVDTIPVGVVAGDDGKVTLCSKERNDTDVGTLSQGSFIGVSTTSHEEEFNGLSTANGFNWYAKDIGHGTHLVEVKAEIMTSFTAMGEFGFATVPTVEGKVRKRTLVIEPTNFNKAP